MMQCPQSWSAEYIFFVFLITLCGGLGGWIGWVRHAGEIAVEGPWQRVPPDISALHRVGAPGDQPEDLGAAESANYEVALTVLTTTTMRANRTGEWWLGVAAGTGRRALLKDYGSDHGARREDGDDDPKGLYFN